MKVTRSTLKKIGNPYKKRKPSNDNIESETESDSTSISKPKRKEKSKAVIVSPESKQKVRCQANEAIKDTHITSKKIESPQTYVSDVDTSHDEYKAEIGYTDGTL